MAAPVNPPRGMRDFLPADKRRRDSIVRIISDTYQRHGFEPIETPVLEDHNTLHAGLGGDNEKLSFQVLRRGLELADVQRLENLDELTDLGLRFDLTVPLARFVATHQAELPGVFRALHIAPVWRAERPQKGRFRQFVQCDIDIVGEPGKLAEREVLLATADALRALGIETYRFRINDRRLLQGVLRAAGVSDDHAQSVLVTLDKLDKIGVDGVVEELNGKFPGEFAIEAIESVLSRAQQGHVTWDAQEVAQLMSVDHDLAAEVVSWAKALAEQIGSDRVVFDPTLVRGMGYYTGSIVELEHPQLGVSLGGGGRYDGMIGRFAKTELPAFGFSLGFERLVDLVDTDGVEQGTRVALVYEADTPIDTLLALKQKLVADGLSVRLVPATRNLKAVFERLQQEGFDRAAQVSGGDVTVADLVWRELGSHR